MIDASSAYEFVFRGLLTEEALDQAGRKPRYGGLLDEIVERVSMGLLDDRFIEPARMMAPVYTTIAAFENTVRELVNGIMVEEFGEDWWADKVNERIRKRAETRGDEEAKHRFHTQRGDAPINYTELKDLLNIMRANWDPFEPFLPSPEWTAGIFESIERSRNVIMHSGELDMEDVERLGVNIRDWIKQVGA